MMLLAQAPLDLKHVCQCATFWALAVGALGLWLVLPTRHWFGKQLGSLLLAVAAALFAYDLPLLGNWLDQGVYWILALVTLGAAVATISSQSPVYSAIWFAQSLLGTAGLFFYNGSQFLGVATIVVYAGAIVVTFLFVIMLSQPEGHSAYDRISWGWFPKTFSLGGAAPRVAPLTFLLGNLRAEAVKPLASDAAIASQSRLSAAGGVLDRAHMANVGRHLFAEHLISVEVAGTLLLVALVGAVAIAIQGKPRLARRIEEALR